MDSYITKDYLALGRTYCDIIGLLEGVPARTSTSRCLMTRPSMINVQPSQVKGKRSHRQHVGAMSHLLGGRIGNWVSPGSQDVGVTNHVSCGAIVDVYVHWVVCIEHVQIW